MLIIIPDMNTSVHNFFFSLPVLRIISGPVVAPSESPLPGQLLWFWALMAYSPVPLQRTDLHLLEECLERGVIQVKDVETKNNGE